MNADDPDKKRDDAKTRWQLIAWGMIDAAGKEWLQEVARNILVVADEPANYRRQMITEAVGLGGKPTKALEYVRLIEAISFLDSLANDPASDPFRLDKSGTRFVAEFMGWTRSEDDPNPALSDAALRSEADYRSRIRTLLKDDQDSWDWLLEVERKRRSPIP